MRKTRWMMGMPITIEIVDAPAHAGAFDEVFAFFSEVDRRFSPFRDTSEVGLINQGLLTLPEASDDLKMLCALGEKTRHESGGYFDIWHEGRFNPSGIVKGWAIDEAASMLVRMGYENLFVDAGGDVQVYGHSASGAPWIIGICNPFHLGQIVKRVQLTDDRGIATSGTYMRGQHIYDPHQPAARLEDIVSVTVIGVDVLEADRFATAAFAMGRKGIYFLEAQPDLEGYMIDCHGRATMTSHFTEYVSRAVAV